MSTTIAQNIEALCQEQGIDRELVIEAIKEAVRAAAKKQFKGGEDIQVGLDVLLFPGFGVERMAEPTGAQDDTVEGPFLHDPDVVPDELRGGHIPAELDQFLPRAGLGVTPEWDQQHHQTQADEKKSRTTHFLPKKAAL